MAKDTQEEIEEAIEVLLEFGDPSEANQDKIYAVGKIQVMIKKLKEVEQQLLKDIEL